jgi:hypothetical protein
MSGGNDTGDFKLKATIFSILQKAFVKAKLSMLWKSNNKDMVCTALFQEYHFYPAVRFTSV